MLCDNPSVTLRVTPPFAQGRLRFGGSKTAPYRFAKDVYKPVGVGALDDPFFFHHAMGANRAMTARAIFTPSAAAEVMPPA